MGDVLVAVVAGEGGGGVLCPLRADGSPAGPAEPVDDLAAAVATRERADRPRWVWASGATVYPGLLRAGVRVERCHDVELTEALLLGYAGHWGEPRSLAAAWARLTGAPVPPDPPPRPPAPPGDGQVALFDAPSGPPGPGIEALTRVYADQLARIAATAHPGRFRLLVAAESAGALIAVEMGAVGLPWRVDVHDRILTELLGEPSPVGGPPRRLAELGARIADAFGLRQLHADSPAELLRAFARAGIDLPNTRAWVLRGWSTRRCRWSWSTRSSTGSGRRTAGPGGTRGSATAGSAPSTCPVGWSPAVGPPGAAGRCRSRR